MAKPTRRPKASTTGTAKAVPVGGIDYEKHFRQLKEAAEEGNGMAVLTAIKHCWYFKHPVPDWLVAALGLAASSYQMAEVRTLDEALGLRRKARWKLPEAKFDSLYGGMCYFAVKALVEDEKQTITLASAYHAVAVDLETSCPGVTWRKVKRNYLYWNSYSD